MFISLFSLTIYIFFIKKGLGILMIYIYLLKIMRGFLIFSFAYKNKQNLIIKRLKTYRNHEIKEFTKITNSNIIQTSFSPHNL